MTTLVNPILDRIELRQKESRRLTEMLRYYQWLESQGLHWSQINGVAKIPLTLGRDMYLQVTRGLKTRHSLLLKDGRTVVLENIPFGDEVIFNRSFIKE